MGLLPVIALQSNLLLNSYSSRISSNKQPLTVLSGASTRTHRWFSVITYKSGTMLLPNKILSNFSSFRAAHYKGLCTSLWVSGSAICCHLRHKEYACSRAATDLLVTAATPTFHRCLCDLCSCLLTSPLAPTSHFSNKCCMALYFLSTGGSSPCSLRWFLTSALLYELWIFITAVRLMDCSY